MYAIVRAGDLTLDIVVVDDGSADGTAEVAAGYGFRVIRHDRNRGASAARNTGVRAAEAEVVAFLDDDCEPAPDWATRLLARYSAGTPGETRGNRILGVGGALPAAPMPGFLYGFLQRHNPLRPLDLSLAASESLPYRLMCYVRALWTAPVADPAREVFSLAGGSMSFRREDLVAVGMFDELMPFGGEDFDLCRRLAGRFPGRPLVYDPAVVVVHHFDPRLRDTLRRSRTYGRGGARLLRKWPTMKPTVFPLPFLFAALLLAAPWWTVTAVAALLLPYVAYGRWLPHLRRSRDLRCLLDPWVNLAQEAYANRGFAEGLWRYRGLPRERSTMTVGG